MEHGEPCDVADGTRRSAIVAGLAREIPRWSAIVLRKAVLVGAGLAIYVLIVGSATAFLLAAFARMAADLGGAVVSTFAAFVLLGPARGVIAVVLAPGPPSIEAAKGFFDLRGLARRG